jgi:hypothetical protein
MKLRNLIALFIFITLINSCSSSDMLLNSGTVHVKYTVSNATFNGELYENKTRLGSVSASIRNTEHPSGKKWGASFKIHPSIHFSNTTYQSGGTRISSTTGILENLPEINIKRLSTLGSLKLNFHTPIGQFSLTGGFGGTLYKLKEKGTYETIKTSEIRKLGLAYTGFFTKRFFVMIGPRYFNDGNEQYVFAARLGYFWGKASSN